MRRLKKRLPDDQDAEMPPDSADAALGSWITEPERAQEDKEGYDDIKVEPRLTTASQRRADIFYVDRYSYKHIHYYTDDVVCHPLCESHIEGEVLDPLGLSTLRKVEGVKAASYAHVLDCARSAAAVSAGLRVITYTTCSFTSLRPR
jgi:hypothetical protein